MSKAAHTPTPWRVTKREYGADLGFFIQTVDMSHKDTFIGEVGGGLQSNAEITANAQFIETAVNHHQELVTTLESLTSAIEGNDIDAINSIVVEARDLLKKLVP